MLVTNCQLSQQAKDTSDTGCMSGKKDLPKQGSETCYRPRPYIIMYQFNTSSYLALFCNYSEVLPTAMVNLILF